VADDYAVSRREMLALLGLGAGGAALPRRAVAMAPDASAPFYGDVALLSLATHRYLRLELDGRVTSDGLGLEPDPNDGAALAWRIAPSDY